MAEPSRLIHLISQLSFEAGVEMVMSAAEELIEQKRQHGSESPNDGTAQLSTVLKRYRRELGTTGEVLAEAADRAHTDNILSMTAGRQWSERAVRNLAEDIGSLAQLTVWAQRGVQGRRWNAYPELLELCFYNLVDAGLDSRYLHARLAEAAYAAIDNPGTRA